MIELYRAEDCPRCRAIEQALQQMSLRHEVTVVTGPGDLPAGVEADGPPVLIDDDGIFVGPDNILKHLQDLEDFREMWYKFQSDVCYCEEEGGV